MGWWRENDRGGGVVVVEEGKLEMLQLVVWVAFLFWSENDSWELVNFGFDQGGFISQWSLKY